MENFYNMAPSPHQYHRQVSPTAEDSLGYLARAIPAGSTVLELGPAMGYFSAYLHAQGCVVDAVEFDASMATSTQPFCRQLCVGDLDALILAAVFEGRKYDFIVLADVLEHVRYPDQLLAQLPDCLVPDGQVLISVPNVAYAGLVLDLLDGRFVYGDEGLLDRTHLHFYTQSSLTDLFAKHGFHAQAWWAVRKSLQDSEFKARLEKMSPAVVAHVAARPDSMAYQWVAAFALEAPVQAPASPKVGLPDQFPIRLFWQTAADAVFSYENSAVVWGRVGDARQTISFHMPVGVTQLRLRLADRIGFVSLHHIISYGVDGVLFAEWQVAQSSVVLSSFDMLFSMEKQGFILQSEDSWLDVPCDFEAGGELELCLSWPMSADYEAALLAWQTEVVAREQTIATVKALVAERDSWLAQRDALLNQRETTILSREATILSREAMIAERDGWLANTQAELARVAKAWEDDATAYQAMVVYRDGLVAERERVIVERDAQLASRTHQWEAQNQQLAKQNDMLADRLRWSWLWRLPWMRWRMWRDSRRDI